MSWVKKSLFACALWVIVTAALAAENTPFEQQVLTTFVAERQTILDGFFRGGKNAELIDIHIDMNGDRRLAMYTLGAEPRHILDATLPSSVVFVDVVRIGGRDRLLTYEPGRLAWLDPTSSATQRTIARIASNFAPPRDNEVPHVDVSRDLNRDGRDDLVLPDANGFWILTQTSAGAFETAVKIGHGADLTGLYGADGYRYDSWSHSRIHEADFNGDGRNDLAFWSDEHFEVHLQDAQRRFSSDAQIFRSAVHFDSDDRYSLTKGQMSGRVLHSLSDLNGDGVADLCVYSLEGHRISEKRSAFEIHLGSQAAAGLTFPPVADVIIRSEDSVQLRMDRIDTGMGYVDLMITSIDRERLQGSLWKRLKGYMGDDIWLRLEFHRVATGVIPLQPNIERRIQLHNTHSIREPGWVPLEVALRGSTHWSRGGLKQAGCFRRDKRCAAHGGAFDTPLLFGDVTGDGLTDLLIGTTPERLDVSIGVRGENVFASELLPVRVDLPDDGEFVWIADLNSDEALDLVIHQVRNNEPDRILTLIARP